MQSSISDCDIQICSPCNHWIQEHHPVLSINHTSQTQDQEDPWNSLQNHTQRLDNCMDSFKVSLKYGTVREGPIPTTSQTPHVILRNVQPGGPNHFWHLYVVHAMGIRMKSLHQSLLWYLHTVKALEKGDYTEANGIRGIINTKGIYTITLDLENDKGKLHNIN